MTNPLKERLSGIRNQLQVSIRYYKYILTEQLRKANNIMICKIGC